MTAGKAALPAVVESGALQLIRLPEISEAAVQQREEKSRRVKAAASPSLRLRERLWALSLVVARFGGHSSIQGTSARRLSHLDVLQNRLCAAASFSLISLLCSPAATSEDAGCQQGSWSVFQGFVDSSCSPCLVGGKASPGASHGVLSSGFAAALRSAAS